ncbi:MAG: GTP-binding protein [bacterium]
MIPVTIITGFLGSGKTTLIQNAVKSIWDKEKVAIIKNEIGDVGVDALELSSPKLTVTELANGCICCTLVGALNEALDKIIQDYKPDRIFIEASGLAKPAQIIISLELVKNVYIDGAIVVIDALNFKKLKEIEKSWAAQSQASFVDLYIINKVDQSDEETIDLIKDDILGIYPTARIIETSDANIPASVIIGLHDSFIDSELNVVENYEHEIYEYQSFSIENYEVLNIQELQNKLENLPKNIYRSKGFFTDISDHKYILNSVAGKVSFKETDKLLPQKNKIVLIGNDILKYRPYVERMLL